MKHNMHNSRFSRRSLAKARRHLFHLTLVLVALSAAAAPTVPLPRASITANDLGIVIPQGDAASEAIGAYYKYARGIPEANIVRIPLTTGAESISSSQFAALKTQVDAALPSNVQATLLTWVKPFRVQGSCNMSITSAFALGYDPKYCNSVFTAPVPYFDADSTMPWQDFNIRPSMMLGASTLEAAIALIDRGVQSDNTYPAGDGYLIRTTDATRSAPRIADFAVLPALWNFPGGITLNYLNNSTGTSTNDIQGKSPVLFYFTGLTIVPGLDTNTFAPGAIGDHLTSFGGILTTSSGQMPSTRWLEAGATGSYGTVEEPYAVADKFPKASVVIDQYFRGATLIEAYWKSVRMPGQGLFLGEPLARPFADQASSTIESGQYVVNTRAFRRDSRYSLEYRQNPDGPWTEHTYFSTDVPRQREYRALLAPSDASLRLTGPCPFATKAVSVSPSGSGLEQAQGGRTQQVYFQVQLSNSATLQSTCDQRVRLSIPALPDGMMASVSPQSFTIKPQESLFAIIAVDVAASIAQTSNVQQDFPVLLTDDRSGQQVAASQLRLTLIAGTSTNSALAPALRIKRPSKDWYLADSPESTSNYEIAVAADVKPGSGIVKVAYELQATHLWDGNDPFSFSTSAWASGQAGQGFATTLTPRMLSPGHYRLRATGFDTSNNMVAAQELALFVDVLYQTASPGQAQSIHFDAIANPQDSSPFAVTASATSGLPVSISSQTPSICSVDYGTVTLLDPGTCILAASQGGNATFDAAPTVIQRFSTDGDVPMPPWATALLAVSLMGSALRATRMKKPTPIFAIIRP